MVLQWMKQMVKWFMTYTVFDVGHFNQTKDVHFALYVQDAACISIWDLNYILHITEYALYLYIILLQFVHTFIIFVDTNIRMMKISKTLLTNHARFSPGIH